MEPSSGGIEDSKTSGPDRGTEDRGTGRIESGGEINLMGLGTNLMANTNEDFPVDIGAAAFALPLEVLSPPPARGAFGYSLRQNPLPNTQIDFSEVIRQREISEQHRLASSWSKIADYVATETQQLHKCLYTNWDVLSARQMVESVTRAWKSFEEIHSRYLPCINQRKRLQEVEGRFRSLKETVISLFEQEERMRMDYEAPKHDDEISVKSEKSQGSSVSSKASSHKKEKLRAALLAKKKVELAKRRAEEDAELARQKVRMELRRLEDEAALAELDWKIERDYDEETGQLETVDEIEKTHLNGCKGPPKGSESERQELPTSTPRKTEKPLGISPVDHSTPSDKIPTSSKSVHLPSYSTVEETKGEVPRVPNRTPMQHSPQGSFRFRTKLDPDTIREETTPKDHVAAMWKVQLLNGITPTQFNGNPADFPFFREQTRTHLESELLTDAQRIEYLPKFLKGEALEVIERNRGCSYKDLMKTLEDRFGKPIQVSQACIDGLVSGPKLAPGDSVSLLNFAEKLNAATKILKGDVEHEASVATNLRRIVSRLPNDLVAKWQTENYEIVNRGRSARLQDIAKFVMRQASIRNDPIFGSQRQRRENSEDKDTRNSSRIKKPPPPRDSTISSTKIERPPEPPRDSTVPPAKSERPPEPGSHIKCSICKSAPHRLQDCPIIKQCDRVAVRRQYAASYGFCFNCGCHNPTHSGATCPDPPACSKCPGHHLTLLHKENSNGRRFRPRTNNGVSSNHNQANSLSATVPPQQQSMGSGAAPQTTNIHQASVSTTEVFVLQGRVLLNVVPVTITAEDGNSLSTYGFLDNGCTDTLIDRQLADQLNLEGTLQRIGIKTIRKSEESIESERVSFTLGPVDGCGRDIEVNEAYVLPDLNQSGQILPDSVDVSEYPHLQDLTFPEVDIKRVSIIIGSNVPAAHLQEEVRVPPDNNGPFGYRFPLGWSIAGPLTCDAKGKTSVNFLSVGMEDQMERFWKIEDYGASKSDDKPLSIEDKRALKILEDTTRIVDGHYEVGLLWKDDQPQLPNNRTLAEKRVELLRRRLTKPGNEEMAAKYRAVMSEYISKGYARMLTHEEAAKESSHTWYLPHHPVMNPNKPGKLRIVFDVAAEYEGTSLNKSLLQGPDMTNSLVGVLLRFRQGKVGLAADVEAMFHQVRVRKEDQDALRFLWWTNDYSQCPDVYVMEVHIFGAASSPCVANSVLRRTAADNAKKFGPEVAAVVEKNFYVDDALPSFSSNTLATRMASDLAKMLDHGGFCLAKFMSNSKEVLSSIPVQRRATPNLDLRLDELPVERALGVRWFVETDELGFEIKNLNRPETKRGILSAVCSLYDPLGFAAPVALTARALIQDMWKAKLDWDQPLEEHFLKRWRSWTTQLPSLSELRIPRYYFPPGVDPKKCRLQLHVFSDASEIGFGASAYLRIVDPDDSIHCSFVMGKARNAPIKFTSIPRLELQAAVLATRLNKMLRKELDLPVQQTKYWTDSEIVLHYLKNEKRRFQTYVANRVEEIRGNSHPDEWNHVPGALNPADDVSRGLNPSDLKFNQRWLRGPEFLWQPESLWPTADCKVVPDEALELKKEAHANHVDVSIHSVAQQTDSCALSPLRVTAKDVMDRILNSCSDWNRLRRRVAWLIRFVHFLRNPNTAQRGHLTLEDYDAATIAITRIVQLSAYPQEIKDLKAKGAVRPSSSIVALDPMLDDHGVLRVKGRIVNPPVADAARNQAILPRDHPITAVIVRHVHESIGHLGREHLISRVREKLWIPQIRVLVRSILGRCLRCKRLNARQIVQQMAPLPRSRMMAYQPPFSYSGMDLFGPLQVKHGRGKAKRWCCLFTCLNTRAVHLELVQSMNTDDFIMCLRRFINRRGEVSELRCDRGSNFVGAERELREAIKQWDQQKIDRELLQRGCKWIFQPPTASSMSGIWERLVRSAKTVLKAILGTQTVSEPVLQTLLTEVERVLNGRALTANSDDPNDLQPLTPAHFLMQRKTICLPPGVFQPADQYRRKWKQVQFLADLFWKRWLREYLPALQVRGKWHRALPNLKPNALVLLMDDSAPRGYWSLGRVLEVYPGSDGMVRTAKVKTKDSVYIRPIQKLCLLENDLESAKL